MSALATLVCPRCKGSLIEEQQALPCTTCSRRWAIKEGVPFFAEGEPETSDDLVDTELDHLSREAESAGWEIALFEYSKRMVVRDGHFREDQRSADWRYLVPLSEQSIALDWGCGWGSLAVSLSWTCRDVYALDSSWEKIRFLNARKKQQSIDNLHPICMRGIGHLPFPENCFNLVSVRGCQWVRRRPETFSEIIRQVYRVLKPGGTAHFNLANRLGFQKLVPRKGTRSCRSLQTLHGYRRSLRRERFCEIQFYAPLPDHEGTPLFYVPLDDGRILNHFLRDIFPLFEMVSPEARRGYAREYAVARMGAGLCRFLNLGGWARLFVPGFSVLAKKAASSTGAGNVA